ncbi:MAG: DNA-binding response regulator [Thermomicrobiales bacterium]|nr:MAG: DNA-binding response regulator [Thermomicrobiales bacterium]
MRVLLIEDDLRLARVIARVLEQERFDVDLAPDGETGLDLALTGAYDILIVDRMLPGRDGIAVIKALRAEQVSTPVLMLTARSELPERVEGLDAGADDYLGKPFAFEELLARLRALARRAERPLLPEVVTIGDVTINLSAHTVHRAGQPVELSPREYALLELLVRNRGRVLSRDQLLERVWGYEAEPQGNVVDLYVHYLRRKLDANGSERDSLIRTVRGAGYMIP